MTGGVVSCTLMVNVPVVDSPSESVTLHVTIVVLSNSKIPPEAGIHVGSGSEKPSSLSVAVEVYSTTVPPGPVASLIILVGSCKAGGVLVVIVTVNVAGSASFSWESIAVQLTVSCT